MSCGVVDEVALDVVTGADVRGVSSGDLYAVYVGAVSVAAVLSSKGDRCGLYAGADWGIVGAYDGGGLGGCVLAFATGCGGGAWTAWGVGVSEGVGNCVGETGLDGEGDAVGVWIGCGNADAIGGTCGRFCVEEVALVVIRIWLLDTVMREGCSMSITVDCAT